MIKNGGADGSPELDLDNMTTGDRRMSKDHRSYVTVTGMKHYAGISPFKIGAKLKCIREPDNEHDHEAIMVIDPDLGKVGYIANSPYTVLRGTMSAGAVACRVRKRFTVKVMFVNNDFAICRVIGGKKK